MYALIDCNNFFASCEQLFNPKLQGKPVVVLSSNDGCVIARSAEAKKLGVPMGAPAFMHRSLFLQYNVITLSSNFTLYGDMSKRVMETLKTFDLPLEVYSIDEAFMLLGEADLKFGEEIRNKVLKWTGIPLSIGIAPTKTLAKVATHLAKKQGGVLSLPDENTAHPYLEKFPVENVWGIGRRLKKRLYSSGIFTANDLKNQSDVWVKKNLSIAGLRTVWELRGTPCIECLEGTSLKKSIVSSRSFGQKITTLTKLKEAVSTFMSRAARKLRKEKLKAYFVVVFITSDPYKEKPFSYSASFHLPLPSSFKPDLIACALRLLENIFEEGVSYKKAGVMVGELISEDDTQLDLFSKDSKGVHKKALMSSLDKINNKFEKRMVTFASEGTVKNWATKQVSRSPAYTTSWDELPQVKDSK